MSGEESEERKKETLLGPIYAAENTRTHMHTHIKTHLKQLPHLSVAVEVFKLAISKQF